MRIQKWEVGPVKLVNGWDAVIHHFCEKRKQYIGGVRDGRGSWFAREWNDLGWYSDGIGQGDSMNLAPPPKKTLRVHGWLNIYPNGTASFWSHKDIADSQKHRFACIEIDREAEEGEGLDPNVRSDAANMRRGSDGR